MLKSSAYFCPVWLGGWTGLVLLSALGCSPGGGEMTLAPIPLGGLDPVLLVHGKEVVGDESLALTHGSYRYLFSGAVSRATFEETPERYAVQLDGGCASSGGNESTDPDLFAVHKGRIYLFCGAECLEVFRADPDGYACDPWENENGVRLSRARSIPQSWLERDAETQDWPQWGGPHRNFKSPARGLATSWPEDGPKRLWSRSLGDGFSSIAVARGTLYTMYRRGENEVVVALDAATGDTRWEYAYPAPFSEEYNLEFGPGPHSTPLVVGRHVFTAGATGRVHALERTTGRRAGQQGRGIPGRR